LFQFGSNPYRMEIVRISRPGNPRISARDGTKVSQYLTLYDYCSSPLDASGERMSRRDEVPEVGGRSPESGLARSKSAPGASGSARKPTEIRELCKPQKTVDWQTECNSRYSWTHSDKRLTQVCERGGRGLLNDECWSFPPASEREARMDDPTHRSKKDR
jgi:hypothetical protein